MASALLGALLRRDANRGRRAGTGRQTTKRAFTISLPGMQHHAAAASSSDTAHATALAASQRGVKRDSKGLDDVNHFWRDSLEAGDDAPEAAATEHEDSEAQQQQAEANANGEPTPFRRNNKLMRTPAAGAAPEEGDAADEEEGEEQQPPAAVPISWDDEEMLPPDFGEAPAADTAQEDAAPVDERHSMGTSPLAPSGVADRRCVSMGTSPIAPSLLEGGTMPEDGEGGGGEFDESGGGEFDGGGGGEFDGGGDSDDDHQAHDPGPDDEFEAQPPPPPTAPPKARKEGGRKRKTSLEKLGQPPAAQQQTEAALLPGGDGRSRRQRFRPLEYWRGERVVYGRRDSAKFEAIIDVEVNEREPTPPHFRKRREKAAAGTSSALVPVADDALANAVDALAEDEPVPIASGRRVKKKAKKATA